MDTGVHFRISLICLALGGVILFSLLQGGFQVEPTLTITLGGDVILGRDDQVIFTEDPWGGMAQTQTLPDGSQNWFLVNLESPLGSVAGTKVTRKGYNLCAPPEVAEILKMGGVDLVSAVNNHQGDCTEPVEPSQALAGIVPIFEGQPAFLESLAGTVAILAVGAVSKPLDMAALLASVAELKAKSDVLIVSLHWGMEYAGEPTPFQRDQARQLANAGVDVLWGHHPHVLQPAEWVESEDGNHHMLALYSLGNLLTDQSMTYEMRHSALIQLQFQEGEISQLSLRPLVLTQKDGRLALASPDEEEVIQINKRLGWAEIMESFP